MEARKTRGAEIVRAGGIRQKGNNLWLVPSQSHEGTWVVDYEGDSPTCTCPDFEKRSAFCKHIFAIEILQHRMAAPTPEKVKTPRNWTAYNAAQMNEEDHFYPLLHALCQGIVMPAQGRGRPRFPLNDLIFGCICKVYTTWSGRRAHSTLNGRESSGFPRKLPKPNTISDALSSLEMTPILRTLLQESALPLSAVEHIFAPDSTGFSTSTYDRWVEEKWGSGNQSRSRAKFRKAHAICGTRTHIVTDLLVNDHGDATQFRELLDVTGRHFDVKEVTADKAYLSKANLELAAKMGAVPYIPFKDGMTAKTGNEPKFWDRMLHFYQYKREEFNAHYHQRSQIESTFSMVKRKFGPALRSKSQEAQVNEVYCKFICHNICVLISSIYELGIQPEFWAQEAS